MAAPGAGSKSDRVKSSSGQFYTNWEKCEDGEDEEDWSKTNYEDIVERKRFYREILRISRSRADFTGRYIRPPHTFSVLKEAQ